MILLIAVVIVTALVLETARALLVRRAARRSVRARLAAVELERAARVGLLTYERPPFPYDRQPAPSGRKAGL